MIWDLRTSSAAMSATEAVSRPHDPSVEPLAEGVGFEPTVSCPTHALQACRFVRSRIPPWRSACYARARSGSVWLSQAPFTVDG